MPEVPSTPNATHELWEATDHMIGKRAALRAGVARRPTLAGRIKGRLTRPGRPEQMPALTVGERLPAVVVIPTALASGEVNGRERVWMETLISSVVPTLGRHDEVVVVLDSAAPAIEAARFREMVGSIGVVRLVEASGPFSFSDRVNTGVAEAGAATVVLLNDDTDIISPDWLDSLVVAANSPGVGAVGATLLYEDGSLQHAGLTTTDRLPTHAYYGWSPDDTVDGGRLGDDRAAWAVTGACLAVSRANWDRVGGFSAEFPVNYNDVDFCLKLAEEGLVNVMLAGVLLHHFETRTRPRQLASTEVEAIQRRWYHRLGPDPLLIGTSALVDRRERAHG